MSCFLELQQLLLLLPTNYRGYVVLYILHRSHHLELQVKSAKTRKAGFSEYVTQQCIFRAKMASLSAWLGASCKTK